MKKTVALKTLTLADCFLCVACFLTCCHSFSVVQSMIASSVCVCLCVFMCLLQPVRRLRSVSMPGENPQTCIAALETSNNYLRPPAERLPSITQSIKRLDTHTHTQVYKENSSILSFYFLQLLISSFCFYKQNP